MPVCEGLSQTLFCIVPSNCLSKREADFLQNLIASFYDVVMQIFFLVPEKFGSIANMIELNGGPSYDPYATHGASYASSGPLTHAYDNVIQELLDDYGVIHNRNKIIILSCNI